MIGIAIGLLIAVVLLLIELVLKSRGKTVIEHVYHTVDKKQKGAIIESPSEGDIARQQIIDQNNAKGLDTKLADLYDDL